MAIKTRIKEVYDGYIPQTKFLFFWVDIGCLERYTRIESEEVIRSYLYKKTFKVKYFKYPEDQ